jgi:diazepam-binding inhibitor (GABA receptor modulating acyl-CoA-binding protein)
MSLEEQFNKAAYLVTNGPSKQSSNAEKLEFYSLFKQATIGDVQGSQPWAVNLEARAKWDSWNSKKGMSKEDAMKKYVELVSAADSNWEQHETLKNYK